VALFIVSIAEVYAWQSLDYEVFDRYTQKTVTESQPGLVGKTALMMYAFDHVATVLQFNVQTTELTHWCGTSYSKTLDVSERDHAIGDEFIHKYSINMKDYTPQEAKDYASINDWFVRKLAPGARPIPFRNVSTIVGSPADARLNVFDNDQTLPIWIKGEKFDMGTLLGDADMGKTLKDGSIAIVRLAPADYHRFHAPIDGKLTKIRDLPGTYLSVNADAATSENNVFYNLRKVAYIDSPVFGTVAYVAIGATCVGSVTWTAKAGDDLKRGDEYGFMAFGGSTVIMIFPKGKVAWENDVQNNSQRRVETLVRVQAAIGRLPQ
jgi:phosphatidylserine decarboxylase